MGRKREKAVVAVVSIGGSRHWFNICLPWMNHYCRRFQCDLLVFRSPLISNLTIEQFDRQQNYGRCQKLGIGFLLETYDRVIQLDDTCMISPLTPDLTELVPESAIGCYVEGPDLRERFHPYFAAHQALYGRATALPKDRFYNSGVAVYSRSHAELFNLESIPWSTIQADTLFPHQGYVSHKAESLDLPLHDFGLRFNYVGSRIKKLRRIEDAKANIFHLTTAFSSDQRVAVARAINEYFRSLLS